MEQANIHTQKPLISDRAHLDAGASQSPATDRAHSETTSGGESLETQTAASRQVGPDPKVMLDTIVLPDDAGDHADGLARILARIPENWGRWISCDAGWYPLLVTLDARLSELAPDYEVHQVKEKFGTLRFYWALPARQPECCTTLDIEDPRPLPGAVTGPWVEKSRTAEDQARMDAWWERRTRHLESAGHAEALAHMNAGPETTRRREAARLIEELVDATEAASAQICERCGAAGSLRSDRGWLKTLCVLCAAETGYKALPDGEAGGAD